MYVIIEIKRSGMHVVLFSECLRQFAAVYPPKHLSSIMLPVTFWCSRPNRSFFLVSSIMVLFRRSLQTFHFQRSSWVLYRTVFQRNNFSDFFGQFARIHDTKTRAESCRIDVSYCVRALHSKQLRFYSFNCTLGTTRIYLGLLGAC